LLSLGSHPGRTFKPPAANNSFPHAQLIAFLLTLAGAIGGFLSDGKT